MTCKSCLVALILIVLVSGCVGSTAEQQDPTPTPTPVKAIASSPRPTPSKLNTRKLLADIKELQLAGFKLNRADAQVCSQQRLDTSPKVTELRESVERSGWGDATPRIRLVYTKVGDCLNCGDAGIDSCNELKRLLIAADLELKGKLPANNGELPECVSSECNCSDFEDKAEAQRVLFAFPDDPFKLDRDVDGVACE